tara:strand:- start:476 stop:940 length:465 start_codon:yes stop_codon:yes gene_type:complete
MEKTEIIIFIFGLISICALLFSIITYNHNIDTRGDIFTGEVVTNSNNEKTVNITDYFNSDTAKNFFKNYISSSFNFINYDDQFRIALSGEDPINNGLRYVIQKTPPLDYLSRGKYLPIVIQNNSWNYKKNDCGYNCITPNAVTKEGNIFMFKKS